MGGAGIDKKLSSRAQKLAAVPEDEFEGMLGEFQQLRTPTGEASAICIYSSLRGRSSWAVKLFLLSFWLRFFR